MIMSDLLARLKAGHGARRLIKLAEVGFELRLLTEQDYLETGISVIEYFKSQGVALDIATAELFESEKATQLLMRALVVPGTDDAVAASPAQLRTALSRDEKNWLVEEYLDFEKTYSPSDRTMGEKEFAALLEEVKKNPQTTRLNNSSTATLKRLITALVSPPAN